VFIVVSSGWFHTTSGATAPSSSDLDETIIVPKNTSSRRERSGAASRQTLILLIRGMKRYLALMENQSVLLGRIDSDKHLYPDVDLTTYGAHDHGVSRQHLRLTLLHRQFYVTDLNSRNGTQLNGESLSPHKPYPLHNGDELLLGRLTLQVLFS
jgi:hypothetical protein